MWTPSALKSEARRGGGDIWRVVEHQYTVSTLNLVDTHAEQAILEDILEEGKPPYPAGTESLHYLLKTPFRYFPPRPHGSRFRVPYGPAGVYYGSAEIRTAMAEMAYYRVRFFLAAPSCVSPVQSHKLTVFLARYQCPLVVDLTSKALANEVQTWTHPTDYSGTQAFAQVARATDVCAILYTSARDPEQGKNIALLTPTAFNGGGIVQEQAWYMVIKEKEVYAARAGTIAQEEMFIFAR